MGYLGVLGFRVYGACGGGVLGAVLGVFRTKAFIQQGVSLLHFGRSLHAKGRMIVL